MQHHVAGNDHVHLASSHAANAQMLDGLKDGNLKEVMSILVPNCISRIMMNYICTVYMGVS